MLLHFQKLDEDDIRLVEEWNQSSQNNLDRKSSIENESKDWELGRLLSARSARKNSYGFLSRLWQSGRRYFDYTDRRK